MTFTRHLALRGASHARPLRTRSYQRFIRRCLASEASSTPFQTSNTHEPIPSVFAPESNDDGLRADLIQAYFNRNTLLHTTAKLGSEVDPHYKPNEIYVNPPLPSEVSVELLIASQTHFGHSTSSWHPANSRYIFGVREGIHIISSDITAAHLRRAAKIVSGVAERAGIILFVGTRKGHERTVIKAAELAGAYHLFDRWIPGTITNGQKILERCTAKVVDELDQQVDGFEEQLLEIPALKPDLIICLNPLENYVMLHECGLANIPTIGIVDTNTNPTWVTYPIPANDDSLRSVALIGMVLGKAGQAGQAARLQEARQGKVSYLPSTRLERRKRENGESSEQDAQKAEDVDRAPGLQDSRDRLGHGTNFFESGLSPSGAGSVLGSGGARSRRIGDDQPLGDEVASEETRATPGKRPTLASDRDLRPDDGSGFDPLMRQSKQEDKEMLEGESQVK